jgi:2-oxoglutarate ferredoxin oxidoreductase subunit delta
MAQEDNQSALAEQQAPPRQARKRPRGEVQVFDNWCKGCGICIEFCPQKVFEVNGDGRPRVAQPDKCIACHWCDTHCPDLAIVVRRVDPHEEA